MNTNIKSDNLGEENKALSVFCFDSIHITEAVIIDLIFERIKTEQKKYKKGSLVVSVDEYRKLLNDFTSSTERIKERLQYLEVFCRNIIKFELEKNVKNNK